MQKSAKNSKPRQTRSSGELGGRGYLKCVKCGLFELPAITREGLAERLRKLLQEQQEPLPPDVAELHAGAHYKLGALVAGCRILADELEGICVFCSTGGTHG